VAVALLFRVAIAFGTTAYRICAGPALDPQTCAHRIESVWNLLTDPGADPDAISATLTAAGGGADGEGAWLVTDFTGSFELRKLQWRLSRAPAGRLEDVDVCTFHFIKATGGTPGSYVDGTDLPAVETALDTFVTTYKTRIMPFTHSDQYRWYKDGPAFYTLPSGGTSYVPIGDNPAIRVTEVDVAGTGTGSNTLPPQVAMTVTEKTSSRKHWGRFYLPQQIMGTLDATGLFAASEVSAILGAAVTFYNSCRAASMVPVVWSIQKPDRPKSGGGTLPAVSAVAYEVLSLQVDDIVDIIRRRRYKVGVTKSSTALT
jgi:hypothetical protein